MTLREYRKCKRPFPPPAGGVEEIHTAFATARGAPAPCPAARRGWEYSLDAMSAAGRGQAQPGRDERCWNASLDAMSIAVRDTAYTWVVSSWACPQTFCVPVAS